MEAVFPRDESEAERSPWRGEAGAAGRHVKATWPQAEGTVGQESSAVRAGPGMPGRAADTFERQHA